jgi:hypothetical protein
MASVFESTERELERLGVAGSALAAVALAMAEQIDGPGSATSKSMCAKVLADVLRELRALAPPRTLGGLLILEERLITVSAHQFDTSLETFRRLLHYFENYDELTRRVKRISKSHGEEGIELLSGQRVRFRTRTAGGGRGFTGDCLFMNEAMILRETSMGALFPTMSARPNPQLYYLGSPVDQLVHEHGIVLARVRERAFRREPGLAYFEYAAADDLESLDPDDRTGWMAANPALGHRIGLEFVEAEQRAMDPKTFAVERLGVGDWPDTRADESDRITQEMWRACLDASAKPAELQCVAFDVRPDRSGATIAAAAGTGPANRFVQVSGTAREQDGSLRRSRI